MTKRSRLKAWLQRAGGGHRASSKTTDSPLSAVVAASESSPVENSTPSTTAAQVQKPTTAPAALESSSVEDETSSTPVDHVQEPATPTVSSVIPAQIDNTHTRDNNAATLRRIMDSRGYEGRLDDRGANYRYAVNRLSGTDLNWILGLACYLGHGDVVAELLAQHVSCSETSLFTVSRWESWRVAPQMLPLPGGAKPLHIAVCGKRPRIIRLLAANGAEPNPRDETGRRPLHYAEDEAVVRTLLDCGEQIDARDDAGDTPLLAAAREGRKAALEALIANGADVVNERDAAGQTAMWLVPMKDPKFLNVLMRGGVDIANTRDAEGRTLLHVAAARKGGSVFVYGLLNRGANVDSRDAEGRTPLFHAVLGIRHGAIQELLKRGADIEARDAQGLTPMMLAREKNLAYTVRMLMEKQGPAARAETEAWLSSRPPSWPKRDHERSPGRAAAVWDRNEDAYRTDYLNLVWD